MNRREDTDRSETRRRSHHHRSSHDDDYQRSSDKSRSRRDDRERHGRRRDSSKERRGYEDRRGSGSSRRKDHSSSSRSKDDGRGRSRSRSRSPYMKRERGRPSTPPREDSASKQSTRVSSNWSDSSDEDVRSSQTYNSVEERSRTSTSYQVNYDQGTASTMAHSYGYNPTHVNMSMLSDASSSPPTTGGSGPAGISLKLAGSAAKSTPVTPVPLPKVFTTTIQPKPVKVAAIFNTDSDDEPEEMPAECKMRMKNIGRETRTSEGPNSFGKTKIGFCNLSHLTEKRLEGTGKAAGYSKIT